MKSTIKNQQSKMKRFIQNILTAFVVVSCMGQGQGTASVQGQPEEYVAELNPAQSRSQKQAEQPRTVRACAPEMNNMEMLSITQLPGWQFLAGTQWMGNTYTNSIKGVNDNLHASFFHDGQRGYTQSPMGRPGTTDGKTVYLNVMSAADYLDYVFHRQFPNVKGARRAKLTTADMLSEAERRQMEEQRMALYNYAVQFNSQSATGANAHIRGVTVDRASADYKWVQDGDTIVHLMTVQINAIYTDYRSPYMNTQEVAWNQGWLLTITCPVKTKKKVDEDVYRIISSVKWNDRYVASLNNIVAGGMRRVEEENIRRNIEMAQAEARHQQQMLQMIKETGEYVANNQREVFANQQATMERVNRGWTDAIVGVDRYMGVDGKAVEVPVSMGSKAWQSADGGTIYTSDSYMFHPVDNLYDKAGNWQDFRQLQLLK
jgi:hypothetical protein